MYLTITSIYYIIITVGKSFDNQPNSVAVKNRKIFQKRDVFVYSALILLIVALFLSLTVFNKKNSNGFKVSVSGNTVVTHIYGQGFNVSQDFSSNVTITSIDDGYSIRIDFEDGFNLILVNESDNSVKMEDSDCPSKNCVYMQTVTDAGAIYCAPRELKIVPLTDEYTTPTTGGAG